MRLVKPDVLALPLSLVSRVNVHRFEKEVTHERNYL